MARLKGAIKFTGKLGELSAYETQDGIIVRQKWGPDKKRQKKDPAFKRMWNQSQEFGECAKAASLLRYAIVALINSTCDNRLSSRLNKVMNSIKNMDSSSEPGKRQVSNGLLNPKAKALLNNFNLNIAAGLGQIIYKPYQVGIQNSLIDFGKITPGKDIKAPKGATHVIIEGGHAVIDFKKKVSFTVQDQVKLALKGGRQPVQLHLQNNSTIQGLHIFVLKITFLQEVNRTIHALSDAKWKGCEIVAAY